MERHLPILIPLTLLTTAVVIPLVGGMSKRLAHPLAMVGTLLSLVFAIWGLARVLLEGPMRYHLGGWIPPIGIELVLDHLSSMMTVIILGVALPVLIHARKSIEAEHPDQVVPFFGICLLLLLGLTGIVLTGDLFNLYVFLEISSLAGYALVAVGDRQAPVAAFRYLILGTAGATFYLLGVGLVFMMTGSLNMADLVGLLPHVQDSPPVIVGFVLMVIGIGLKMALFPLHVWLPDAYTHASSAGSSLLAPLGTKVAAYVLIRLVLFVFSREYAREELIVLDVIVWLAFGGIIAGSILAVAQTEMKRMLAYSSVAQIGYIALGIGLGSTLGLIGAMLHIMNHAVMKGALFLVAGNLRLKIGHSDLDRFDYSIQQQMPWSTAGFSVAALSMVGIPPLAGFFSKWYLVLASVEQNAWSAVAVIALGSLISAVYFFRVLERVYLRPPLAMGTATVSPTASNEAPLSMLIPVIALSVGLIVLGLLNAVIIDAAIAPLIPARWEKVP
jgi:multicomponent Na+:H+ antiporter subunit D